MSPEDAPFANLKFEGGVHRVQRVPVTESQGRIHTSAAGVLVLPEAEEVEFDGTKILFLPWINSQNTIHSESMINKTTAGICMGHLEIAGFEMMKGMLNEHGINKSMFRKFDTVFSGISKRVISRSGIEYCGVVTGYDGQVIESSQFPASVGSECIIQSRDGTSSKGEIIGFKDDKNIIFQYEKTVEIFNGDRIVASGGVKKLTLGRTF